MRKISIIMPLYNAEKYLEECLDSVLKQTLTDFELLCIDDASTDSTLEILQNFQKIDRRIRILSNEARSGAAYSRNRGIEEAEGQYLSFLDGDDVFDEEMLSKAYQAAAESAADIVIFEYKHVPSDSIHSKLSVFHSEKYIQRYCEKPFCIRDYGPDEWLNWNLGPWNKIYKREFIINNRLTFQDLPSSNDVFFVCMALMLSEKILCLNDNRVMVYVRDHDEPTRISADRDPMCSYRAFFHIAEELRARNLFCDLYAHFYYRLYKAFSSVLRSCRTGEKAKNFYQFLQEEGIEKIRSMAEECYDNLDDFIRSRIEQLQSMDFDSGWYKEELGLKMQLSQKGNAKTVIYLFEKYQKLHKKVGVWGTGANGISVLAFCRENQLQVDMVVDKSKAKQGCIIEEYQVKAPEEIGDTLQVVIVSTRYIAESVREELLAQEIEVIDLNELLYVY